MTNNLLVHYPFKQDTLDYSGQNMHAISYGSKLKKSRFGRFGSYSFDGKNDYLEIENPKSLSFSNESFTISLWVKIQDNDNTYKTLFVISNDALMPRIELMKARSGFFNGGFYFQIAQSEESQSTAFSLESGFSLPRNVWIHLVGVANIEDETLSLYVNSALQETVPLIQDFTMPPEKELMARIGKTTSKTIGANEQRHKGSIDDFKIFSTALSQRQIERIYKYSRCYDNSN
jgi:hypothetical protein